MFFGKIKETPLDIAMSWLVRTIAKWKCERCHKQFKPPTKALHCSHFWGRGNWKTRHDLDNCSAHCYGCHQYLGSNPQEFREWQLQKLGKEKFEALSRRAHWRTRERFDKKLIELWLRQELPKYGLDPNDFFMKKEKREMCPCKLYPPHCTIHHRSKKKEKPKRKDSSVNID